MKKLFSLILLIFATLSLQAQMVDPVHGSATLKTDGTAQAKMVFHLTIDPGWHVYSTNLGQDGPIEASLHINKLDGVELVGKLRPVGKEINTFDNIFQMKLRYFEKSATFEQDVRFTKPQYSVDAYLEYGACNDEACMPPQELALKHSGKAPASAEADKAEEKTTEDAEGLISAGDTMAADTTVIDTTTTAKLNEGDWWAPSINQMKATDDLTSHTLWYILLMGIVGGLLALVMPCIWPIIPMTVSFFMKRAKDNKKKGIRDAVLYGLSIIIIFLALGILFTAIWGPSQLNALSTNAVFNILLFLLLVVFAVSFFGWFEIKLPDSWANKVDSKASEATGFISIFLMAFTLVLVSFSCTAPIIGLLLVETVTSGNWVAPAVGMFGFALALALPFTLFALFPSWLKSVPKSGGWMNTIKVVLGFIELAFSLKFFSVADLAYGWHLLDRETFLSLWIAIFLFLGLYLIGILKFQSDDDGSGEQKARSVPEIMLGLCAIAFSIYMLPGLWGAPVKAVSAFAPPMNTQDFNLNTKVVEAKYTDYDLGMQAAAQQGKPVMIDFTGFGCVNCRKMEAAVWTDPKVASLLEDKYVLISLYVDDKTPLPKPIDVIFMGRKKTLRTVGDKWSYLQAMKFGSNTQPFYVPLDNEGNPLNGSYSYKEDIQGYVDFLQTALDKYGLPPAPSRSLPPAPSSERGR